MSDASQRSRGPGWKLSAVLVGLVATFVAGWAVNALDLDNGWIYFPAWLVIALGFIGIITVLLVPRAGSQRRSRLPDAAHRK